MEMLNYKDFENYSRLELSEKFKNEFTSKYFEENYTKDNWEKLIQIYDKFMISYINFFSFNSFICKTEMITVLT